MAEQTPTTFARIGLAFTQYLDERDQRMVDAMTTLQAHMDAGFALVHRRIDDSNSRVDDMGKRVDGMGKRVDGMEGRFDRPEAKMDAMLQAMGNLQGQIAHLERRTRTAPGAAE